ncbi:MAG: adenylate/guanylate cyclase domain-containing protein [Verrucomicrobia bacterium]|nr:adenylate/guanylate cyclase domain-containing protein [Verrucomicrobiota bacterium]
MKNTSALVRWLVLLAIPLLWCLAWGQGWLDKLEQQSVDLRFTARGELDAPVKVIYVDIDSQSLSEIGGFPWSRSFFARTCAALVDQAHVRAVGVDIVFSENGVAEAIDWKKRVEGNRELARYLLKTPPVVVAASYAAAADRDINGALIYRQLPRLSRLAPGAVGSMPEVPAFRVKESDASRLWSPALIGLIDTMDGGTRVVPAYAPTAVRKYLHMSLELARLYYGVPNEGVKITDGHIDLVRADGTVAAHIPLEERQLVEVNWFSAWKSARNPRIGFSTVYNYAEMLTSEKPEERKAAAEFFGQPDFKDAIVLIGPVDPLLQDLATTPFDQVQPVPKVGIHGNMLKTIVSGKYLRHLPVWRDLPWADFLVIYALALLVAGVAATGVGRRTSLRKITAILALGGYIALAFWLFASAEFVLPLVAPVGAAFTTSFVGVIAQLIEEQRQKGRIKGMFGSYLSPQLVNRMVETGEDPQLGGHDAEITAYFSDIQSFSTFSEKLGSGPLVELMNEYLTACTDIVQEEGGTLDKYIGDAVVAMFGAPIALPDHAYRACVAALRVHHKLGELRKKWEAEGQKWPEIVWKMQTRIGLNSGVCMIGNMGSRSRFSYTMMGDNVNLAARMESGAKAWGAYTMCSEATKLLCEQHGGDRIVFRPLGRIVVKGRSTAVPIFEPVGLKENVSDATRECIRLFTEGLEKYYARDWAGAIALFEKSRDLEPNVPGKTPGVVSNPSLVYLERVIPEAIEEPPPADWDGRYVMKEK